MKPSHHNAKEKFPRIRKRLPITNRTPVVEEIERNAKLLTEPDDYAGLAIDLADKQVVMLGEATHGSHEFYEIRGKLTQLLIEEHGFNIVAVEGDWPDCYSLNQLIHDEKSRDVRAAMKAFKRWPTWMWANSEVAELIQWMRGRDVGFYGLDVYSLFESAGVLREYAAQIGGDFAERIQRRLNCFLPFEKDEISYARALMLHHHGCEEEVTANLKELLTLRLQKTSFQGEQLFDIEQNARVMKNAESYYRAMLNGEADSWNIRDSHMMDTLATLLRRRGPDAKAIVWAHNTHIGDYRATDMVREGYVNIGGLARERFGHDKVALVGFGSHSGTVLAGRAWGAPEEVMLLPPALGESNEDHFHQAAEEMKQNQFYIKFDSATRFEELSVRRGHRAVGVVYSPETNQRGHFVPTELTKRYDVFVHVDRSTALKSLHYETAASLFPETWPTGQ